MRDLATNTENDAGLIDRAQAHPIDDRDHDEPSPAPEHTCTSPDPERCLFCVLDGAVARLKAARA